LKLADDAVKTERLGSVLVTIGRQMVTDDVARGPATLGVTAMEKRGLVVDPRTKRVIESRGKFCTPLAWPAAP